MHNKNGKKGEANPEPKPEMLHPAWVALIRHCRDLGYGEIEHLKIQDGLPVMIEKSRQRIKLA